MSRILRFFFIIACAAQIMACNSARLEDMEEQLERHEAEIQRLSSLVESANSSVAALQATVLEIKSGGYVTSVVPKKENEKIVGYTITFGSGETIFVSSEEQQTPRISVRSYSGGDYYWTLDNDWLLDSNGDKLPVTEGSPAPQISSDGDNWIVSFDNGQSWIINDKTITGSQLVKALDTSNPDYVLITLSDGTVLQLTTWTAHMKLKNLVNQLNNNLNSLETIVNALKDNDYLTSISPFIESGEQVGWLLNFSKSGSMVVYTLAGSPNQQYQVVSGNWVITDQNGNVSDAGTATGGDQSTFINGIDTGNSDYVTLSLSNGTALDIPRYKHTAIRLNMPADTLQLTLSETISIEYRLTGSEAHNATVTAFSDGHFITSVSKTSSKTGVISITCSSYYLNGYVTVLMTDTNGYCATQIIPFKYYGPIYPDENLKLVYGEINSIIVPPEGGNYTMEITSYGGLAYAYNTVDWFSSYVEETNQRTVYLIHFTVQPNRDKNGTIREHILDLNQNYYPRGQFKITQLWEPDEEQ